MENWIETEEVRIEIKDELGQLERATKRFMERDDVSARNKELVGKFLRDAALGKTVVGRAKKQIGLSRRNSYVTQVTILIEFVKKDLDQVTMEDMERFVEALEQGQITSRRPSALGKTGFVVGGGLSKRYAADVKVTIRKFYKWLWGENRQYPELVEWIDTSFEPKEVSALSEADVRRMLDFTRSIQHRAVIQVLFDGGFRIGELLNIRLRHVWRRTVVPNDPQTTCFFVRIPFSKTLRRTVVLPMPETTRLLGLWLEQHPARPTVQAEGVLSATDLNTPLFSLKAAGVRQVVRRAGASALGRRVYPHLLRHTSATYWCNKIGHYKLAKRFGWTMVSKMPQRYIDRSGVDEEEVANLYFARGDRMERKAGDVLLAATGSEP